MWNGVLKYSVEMVTYNFWKISEIKHKEQCGMVGYNSGGKSEIAKIQRTMWNKELKFRGNIRNITQ